MKKYRLRKKCRLCNSLKLTKFLPLPSVAPGEQLREKKSQKFYEVPIDLFQCQNCFHVQLINIPQENLMWNNEYTFMPGNNKKIIKHFINVVNHFYKTHNKKVENAFEIGSNDGLFLEILKKKYNCNILGIDPSEIPRSVAIDKGIETLPDFFTHELSKKISKERGSFDLVIANNVFAHADNLSNMTRGISNLLTDGGYFIFEASYLKDVLCKKLIGTIIHEHLSVHSLISFEPFLKKFNLFLVDVIHDSNIQGGVIVGIVKKNSNKNRILKSKKLIDMIKIEKSYRLNKKNGLKNYKKEFYNEIRNLKKKIEKLFNNKDNKKLFFYGAARSIQIMIKLFFLESKIKGVLENNRFKFNKFLPLHKPIKILNNKKHVFKSSNVYFISAWVHTDKILKIIKSRIKLGETIKCITVFPKFKIINVKK